MRKSRSQKFCQNWHTLRNCFIILGTAKNWSDNSLQAMLAYKLYDKWYATALTLFVNVASNYTNRYAR